jgi:N4-gp56 family major capsid protein
MAIQRYSGPAVGRINKLKGEILAHAIPVEVLGITGQNKPMPKNKGDNVEFRRWLPWGGVDNQFIRASTGDAGASYANAHLTQEGVTPSADTMVPVDVPAILQQYSALYAITDKAVDLHEDDIAPEMKKQTGHRLGLVREMVRYGALKGVTSRTYAGGDDRVEVNKPIGIKALRQITRALNVNHAQMITSILAPSPNYETRAVEAGYLVFCHTDMDSDIRELPGFTPVAEYGTRKPVHERELGSVETFRFITSPELVPYLGAGAAVSTTKLMALDETKIDVYPVIVVAEDAWGQVALRGADSLSVTYLPPNQRDKTDPLGQRGYIGASTWFTAVVLNQGWMAVLECGVTDLEA